MNAKLLSGLRRAALGGACALLAACASLGTPAPQRATYDLGPMGGTVAAAPPALPLQRVRVDAPSWLEGTAMSYRLLYAEPARRQHFRDSSWAAPVGELLQLHLNRALLTQPLQGGGGCVLQLALDEFGLEFSAPEQGEAVLAGRLALLAPDASRVLARRELRLREALSGGNAAAGVEAQRRLLQTLVADAGAWLAGVDRAGGQGFNTGSYCR